MQTQPRLRIQPKLHTEQTIPRLLWLVIGLAMSWALAEYGMALLAPTLALPQRWPTALSIVTLLFLSLEGHVWAHQRLQSSDHTHIPRLVFGDPAQAWPVRQSSISELWAISVGPLFNLLLALVSLLIWNMQLHPMLDAITFAVGLLNLSIALVNIVPAYPLDGGRFWRALLQSCLPARQAQRIVYWVSAILLGGLAAWGLYLISLQARFSPETGATVLAIAALLVASLRYRPAHKQEQISHPQVGSSGRKFLLMASVLVGLAQLSVGAALLPMVDGMYAPGPAVPVGPMISVPAERRSQESRGALLLTTVITQTPITLGQWLWAHISPAYVLVPPERVVPSDMTPQQLIQRNVSMLEESEASAIVVALRLAGFQADVTSTMLQITGVVAESPSARLLQAGDILISAEGVATPSMEILRQQIAQRKAGDQIMLEIERNQQREKFQVMLMPPAEHSQIPRIGVTLQPLGLDTILPFPVSITTQKIVGGPSAGLMFTLAIYDAVTPGDLTHGWKIAGTGTISIDGTVGPIGGIGQKVAGAEWAGAEYFIVPREHEQEARQAAGHIRLIPVSTAQEAIQALQALPDHP